MSAPTNTTRCRILVIDDNDAIHEDFRKILTETSVARTAMREIRSALFGSEKQAPPSVTFEVDYAFQGQEGLALVDRASIEGKPYSMAFVDGRMPPGWDGIETITQLWKKQPDIQVVLCTAYSDYSWEEIRRVLGETDSMVILKKPFDNVEVLQLAHVLSRKWELNRQVQDRLNDLGQLVREQTKQTHQALAFFEASLSQSPLGILIAEAPDVNIRWANSAALDICGKTGQPLTGIAVSEHDVAWRTFRPNGSPYPSQELPLLKAVLRGEITRNEELIIRDSQGQDRWISVNAAPIRSPDGNVSAGIAILQDVTDRKQADIEKESLQAQIVQVQKMESVGRLAGGVAHDFNNMLQTILGNVELALESAPAPSQLADELLEIRNAAQRSTELTRQLLAFARRQTIKPQVLDLNDTVSGMLKMLHRLIGENIQLCWRPNSVLWPVKIDPSQIDQILANLTVNARDAIAGTGTITIETSNATLDAHSARHHPGGKAGDYVMLSVSDTGCGMDAETRSHLFEPFFTTKPVGKGTGLGLATVFGIIQQNNAFIDVRTGPGQGTTFTMYFPRAEIHPEATSVPIRKRPMPGTETILLVEDEPQVLSLGRRILKQLGYTVTGVSTPEAALTLAANQAGPIHLLVTDVVMPGMNGKALREQLQATHPEMKCLFMSGYTADVIACHGVLDEGVHFLQKPFTIQSLAEKVREILDTTASPPP